jgi:4-hydroxy-tetrahydrodipicolinate synthase
MFRGSFTALITPFKGGKVDERAFQQLVEWQIAEAPWARSRRHHHESPTLSHEEHKRVVELCLEAARQRVPVIAGAGSNSTDEAIDFTLHAKKVGAAATLHSTGYYNRPTQEGLFRHFKAINDAADLPIFIYNVPVRTIVDISVATLARCRRELKNVVGIKDATANVARVSQQRLACGQDFVQPRARTARRLLSMAAWAASR